MSVIPITLVVEPTPDSTLSQWVVKPERYKRFAAELGQYAGITVPIVHEHLSSTQIRDGFVILSSSVSLSESLKKCDNALKEELPRRLILLEISRQKALDELERYKLAAVVDSLRFAEWMAGAPPVFGPYGRRDLASLMGANCASLPFLGSDNYCLLENKTSTRDLPHFLADYLQAYAQAMQNSSMLEKMLRAHIATTDKPTGMPS